MIGLAALFSFTLAAAVTVPVMALVAFVMSWPFCLGWSADADSRSASTSPPPHRSESLAREDIAHVPLLHAHEMQVVAGPEADPRAHLVPAQPSPPRGSRSTSPRSDPHWLVSPAHPEQLAAALAEALDPPPGRIRAQHIGSPQRHLWRMRNPRLLTPLVSPRRRPGDPKSLNAIYSRRHEAGDLREERRRAPSSSGFSLGTGRGRSSPGRRGGAAGMARAGRAPQG